MVYLLIDVQSTFFLKNGELSQPHACWVRANALLILERRMIAASRLLGTRYRATWAVWRETNIGAAVPTKREAELMRGYFKHIGAAVPSDYEAAALARIHR